METEFEEPMNRRRPIGLGGMLLTAALAGTVAAGAIGVFREHRYTQSLEAENAQTSEALNQMQTQMQAMSQKLQAMSASATSVAPAPAVTAAPAPLRPAHHRTSVDPRLQRLQSQVDKQQRELAETRQQVVSTSSATQDLQGRLQSTHDELSGSIAASHDELVALEKRGERSYYEFTIDKSKSFQRVGPLGLSLRKANTKHDYFDLVMNVGDQRLEKKHINLYEPVWINLAGRTQPVELVVNEIGKNEVKGYVSEPKYTSSQTAATGASSTSAQASASSPSLKTRPAATSPTTAPPGD